MEPEGSDPYRGAKPSYLDQPAFNYTPSQAATSYAGSMSGERNHGFNHDDDDAQSKASTYTSYTVDSSRQVKRERGRDFNLLSDTYTLPTDVEEWDRLDKQHRAINLGLGGLYPAPEVVRAILAPQEGVTKRIVDLGCGTGIWSIEMARQFPHCEVLGIDLAAVPIPVESLPPNCKFELDDISHGLTHLRDQFDVVFARFIGLGLKDIQQTLADAEASAKPGGIIIWIDGDYDMYCGWPMAYRPFWSASSPQGSYCQRMLYELRRSASLGQSDIKSAEKIVDEGFFGRPSLDPETCKAASLYAPIGTWYDGELDPLQKERLRYIGILMRQDIIEAARSTQPFLLKVGWSKDLTDRWVAGAAEECQKGNLLFRFRLAWGRRRAGPGLPAPTLLLEEGESTTKYPLYDVYDTPEQARAATLIRNQGKDIPPPPSVSQSSE